MANKNLILKNLRCHYPHLVEPQVFEGNEDSAKFSITLLIPKKDKNTVKEIKTFIESAVNSKPEWQVKKAIQDRVLKVAFDTDAGNKFCLLKDGDEINRKRVEEDEKDAIEAYAGHYVLKAARKASFGAPSVVNQSAQNLTSLEIKEEVKAGYWVNVQIGCYCYDFSGSQGASIQLSAVQKVKDDEEFKAPTPFEAIESVDEEETGGAFDE